MSATEPVSGQAASGQPPTVRASLVVGTDGLSRCAWAGSDAEYQRYHDEEWGTPLHGDRALFEKLSLEGFQAGLSWITILRRRDRFRAAFHGFDVARVAAMTGAEVDALMQDAGIIRNRAKIESTIANAALTLELERSGGRSPGSGPDARSDHSQDEHAQDEHAHDESALDRLLWGFAPPPRAEPLRSLAEVPAVTPESTAMSKALRSLGFRFVGPTTLYALMQSSGMVDDHVAGCVRSRTAAAVVQAR